VEIHNTIFLTNSVTGFVSISILRESSQNFAPIPGGGHATCRVELFVPPVVPMWRSTTPYSKSNTASDVNSYRLFSSKTFLKFLCSTSRRGTCNLHCATAPSILLGLGSTLQDSVSLLFSFLPHHCSAPSEHFLRKGLSQIFAPIPGGEHGTVFEWPLHAQLCFGVCETWFNRAR
jgi:hypothetical protein